MNNIESFNIAVAEVFGQCYKSFPIPIDIAVYDLGDHIKQSLHGELPDDPKTSDIEYQIALQSVDWLIDAGYLWGKQSTARKFININLSPKGLEVMNAIPDELINKKSFGEQLSQGVASLGKEATLTAVNTALSLGAKLMIGG